MVGTPGAGAWNASTVLGECGSGGTRSPVPRPLYWPIWKPLAGCWNRFEATCGHIANTQALCGHGPRVVSEGPCLGLCARARREGVWVPETRSIFS